MKKRIFAIPCEPCAAIAMEAWLIYMAEKGWHLKTDGVLFGFALFEKGEARTLRYRLRASLEKPGILAPNGGEPDEEEKELARAEGWEYVARWGDFFIYRTGDEQAPELDTDEKVRDIALKAVRKRIVSDVALTLCEFLVLVGLRLPWLSTMLACGTPFVLAGLTLFGLLVGGEIAKIVHLCRIKRGIEPGNFTARGRWLALWRIAKWVTVIAYICVFLGKWSDSVLEKNKIALEDYQTDPPFATSADFFPEGDYRLLPYGFTNEVREWSDWLAPRLITYDEAAEVTLPDGKVFSGGLYVEYHELRSPFLAKWLFHELSFSTEHKKSFEELILPEVAADQVLGYRDELHFPSVLLRKGNVVLRVRLYETGADLDLLPYETWVAQEADFLP
ncbi:MAG: DUF2812 domain-containing protein [Clostridia bacterium]|nr:DUF2812 domain-containing protein [Clostridia bacterium]